MNSPGRFLAALAVALILVPSSSSLAVGLHFSFGEHESLGLHEPLRLSGVTGHERAHDHDGVHGHQEHHEGSGHHRAGQGGEAAEVSHASGSAGHHHDDPTTDDTCALEAVQKASPVPQSPLLAVTSLPAGVSSVPARDVVPRLRGVPRSTPPPSLLTSLCTLLL